MAIAAIGLVTAFQRAGAGPDARYVVARVDLAPGTVLAAEHLGTQRMELPEGLAARSFGLDESEDLIGTVLTQAVAAGELVQLSDLRRGNGQVEQPAYELSFSVDADRAVDGELRAGERVDVVATVGTGTAATTALVAERVLVLDVDRADGGGFGTDRQVVTVALDDQVSVIAVTAAADSGTITLVRANRG